MDLYDVIRRRRDVRAEFSGEQVPDDVLERVLGAAHAAPSVGHTQPWDFVVVRSPETRRRFQAHVASERDVFAASLSGERAERFAAIKVEGIVESGLGVVVTYDAARGGPDVLGRHAIADAGLYSAVLAIQNLWLAATVESLGVGWVSFYRERFLSDLIDVPAGIRPIAWLCLGPVTRLQDRPDLERFGWAEKRPLGRAVHLERYGRQQTRPLARERGTAGPPAPARMDDVPIPTRSKDNDMADKKKTSTTGPRTGGTSKAAVKKLRADLERAEAKAEKWKVEAKQRKAAAGSAGTRVSELEKQVATLEKRLDKERSKTGSKTGSKAGSKAGSRARRPVTEVVERATEVVADGADAVADAVTPTPDESWTVTRLRAEASSRGVVNYSRKTKAQLIAELA